jgi:hypothetical protein
MGRSLRVVDDMKITCRSAAILADVMSTNNFHSSTDVLSLPGRVHQPPQSDLEYDQENFDKFLVEQQAFLAAGTNS